VRDGKQIEAAGCTAYTIGPNGKREPGCPFTVTSPEYANDTRLAAHEFAHAARRCTTGYSDPSHTDPAIWGPGGFVEGIAAKYPPR
jgi:hypothetical protein